METGNWRIAAGRYHSKTPEKQQIYLKSLTRNIHVANAQINQFRILAGLKPPTHKIAKQIQVHEPEQVANASTKQNHWTAALSMQGTTGDRYRSIYSQAQLQPILPEFNHNAIGRLK